MDVVTHRYVDTGEVDSRNQPIVAWVDGAEIATGNAPGKPGEVFGESQTITEGFGTLYYRTPLATALQNNDEVTVQGVRYRVDGDPVVWEFQGVYKGMVAQLKVRSYSDG